MKQSIKAIAHMYVSNPDLSGFSFRAVKITATKNHKSLFFYAESESNTRCFFEFLKDNEAVYHVEEYVSRKNFKFYGKQAKDGWLCNPASNTKEQAAIKRLIRR